MGLFSFLSKNKQDSAEVSGRFSRPDDEFAERARAKRASHAGGGARRGGSDDPMLPEKKRARRRLVGAIALALAAAIGLPMLLDSEPKPLAGDVDIQIPAKDKAGPLPMPAAPASTPESASAAASAPAQASVAASQSVDRGEEVIEAPPARPAAASPAESARKVVAVQAPAEKTEPPKPAPGVEHKAELAHADAHKDKPKPEPKAPAKPEAKPAHAEDAARAMAILEGKDAAKAHESGDKVVLQVAALATPEKVAELQAKLREAGIRSFTEKYQNLIRVKVGPYSREEAEKVRAQLSRLGLSGKQLPA